MKTTQKQKTIIKFTFIQTFITIVTYKPYIYEENYFITANMILYKPESLIITTTIGIFIILTSINILQLIKNYL